LFRANFADEITLHLDLDGKVNHIGYKPLLSEDVVTQPDVSCSSDFETMILRNARKITPKTKIIIETPAEGAK
jgi:hypothetical protein